MKNSLRNLLSVALGGALLTMWGCSSAKKSVMFDVPDGRYVHTQNLNVEGWESQNFPTPEQDYMVLNVYGLPSKEMGDNADVARISALEAAKAIALRDFASKITGAVVKASKLSNRSSLSMDKTLAEVTGALLAPDLTAYYFMDGSNAVHLFAAMPFSAIDFVATNYGQEVQEETLKLLREQNISLVRDYVAQGNAEKAKAGAYKTR